jgi:hypothetical protein
MRTLLSMMLTLLPSLCCAQADLALATNVAFLKAGIPYAYKEMAQLVGQTACFEANSRWEAEVLCMSVDRSQLMLNDTGLQLFLHSGNASAEHAGHVWKYCERNMNTSICRVVTLSFIRPTR